VGLGLAITKQVVEMMGGQIELQSELGQGSVFRLTLPFATCGGLRDPSAALGEVRVLIVDDNATNRSILREYLGSWGCRTAEAASARQALVLLQEAARHGQPFRVALVDMQMPEADGAMLARWIRADAQLRDLLLISLTSAPVAGEAARLHEIGYAEYLQKPIRQSHLYDILVAALRPRPAPESARRILLAEDNEVNRTIALRILACAGYDADSVSDGRQAVEAVCHGGYDLVLMDIQMPEMDGFEATAEIRRRLAPSACPPIVAMTANALEGDRDRCLLAGMNDYIAKPIRLEELRTTVERWIGPPAARGERLDTSSRPQA
jgi:CheY-like chemotaxis protein